MFSLSGQIYRPTERIKSQEKKNWDKGIKLTLLTNPLKEKQN
jgi:hypothetical protein